MKKIGMNSTQIGNDLFGRLNHPAIKAGLGQNPAPGFKQLNAFGTRFNLFQQILRGRLDQNVDQFGKPIGIAIGKAADIREVLGAFPLDHVGRNGPGRASKADQSCAGRNGT